MIISTLKVFFLTFYRSSSKPENSFNCAWPNWWVTVTMALQYNNLYFKVRIVSDIVQYNFQMTLRNQESHMYTDLDGLILKKIKSRYFRGWQNTVRDAALQLSDYTKIWKKLTNVYPKVRIWHKIWSTYLLITYLLHLFQRHVFMYLKLSVNPEIFFIC